MTVPQSHQVRVRHLAASLAGVMVPLGAAFLAIPVLISQLGLPTFGVLALLMAGLAYLQILDFGAGTALTYTLSRTNSSEGAAGETSLAALGFVFVVGGTVAIGLALIGPVIAAWGAGNGGVDATQMEGGLRWIAASLPALLLGSVATGVMAANGRFEAINAARVVFGSLTYIGAALVTVLQPTLVAACMTIAIVRTAWTALHLWQCRDLLQLRKLGRNAFQWSRLRPLIRFGGWLSVSNVVGPVMVYMDRFYIGYALSAEHVARYVTPYEVATKVTLLPGAVLPVLFPAFVRETAASAFSPPTPPLFVRASVLVAWVCGLCGVSLALVANPLLDFISRGQLGDDSVLVFRVLLAGVLVNSVAQVFFARVQSDGRTDLLAKVHCCELVFYALLLWWLIKGHGILGAAVAWSIRVVLDAAVLCHLACAGSALGRKGCWSALGLTLFTGTAIVSTHALVSFAAISAILAAPVALSFALVWVYGVRSPQGFVEPKQPSTLRS